MQCCLKNFNLINDIFKVVVPQTKLYYRLEEHGVVNNPRRWRQIVVESIRQGYDHKKGWDLMRDVKDTIKIPESKILVKEDCDNDHRTKATTLGKWKH